MAISSSLANKIAKERQLAPSLLPKTRLCAGVVMALTRSEAEVTAAVGELKARLGQNWSVVTALQFMSGRQAKFSSECGDGQERNTLLFAHQISEFICDHMAANKMNFSEIRAFLERNSSDAAANPSPVP